MFVDTEASFSRNTFGAHLGTAPVTAHYNDAGLYPTDLSHQTVPYPVGYGLPHDGVTFNGIAAPLLYYSQNQIDAVRKIFIIVGLAALTPAAAESWGLAS